VQARELISDLFSDSRNELVIGGIGVTDLAQRFGTPLFVYDEGVLLRKWNLLRSTFPERFEIHYSVKANPNLTLLRWFLDRGAGLEIASDGELFLALEAGCPPGLILFAGPGKTNGQIELVLRKKIGEIHAESLTELQRISSIAERLNVVAPVALRINPDAAAEGGAMRMGGVASAFGIDEEQLDEALDYVLTSPSIQLVGLHLFAGTQVLSSDILLAQYAKGFHLARRVTERLRRPLQTLDFGGGLGIPYFSADESLDMVHLQSGLQVLVSEFGEAPAFARTRFVIEPGRFLVGEAGVYLARVLDVKLSRGKRFIILDGGMNHHLAASGNLGQTIKRNFPVVVATRLQEVEVEAGQIVGPLCTPLDVLGRSLPVPRVEVGDVIAILQSGAYARSASPLGFLSHCSPAEVLAGNGEARLIRERGRLSDLVRDMADLKSASMTPQ
jgi:diaminopimelate decarboxylase